jgi:hypothetical protein
MSLRNVPAHLVVRVQEGVPVADAVARHRDCTGYGGSCVIVFESAPPIWKTGSKRVRRRIFASVG